jgi:ABC-type transport system involved in cytochrome bd biosynthesis fused ATPase/permease subunit
MLETDNRNNGDNSVVDLTQFQAGKEKREALRLKTSSRNKFQRFWQRIGKKNGILIIVAVALAVSVFLLSQPKNRTAGQKYAPPEQEESIPGQ